MSYWFNVSRDDYVKTKDGLITSPEWHDGPDCRHQLDIEMTGNNVWTITPYYIGGDHNDTKVKFASVTVTDTDGFALLSILYHVRKSGGEIYGEDDVIF